MDYEGGGCRMKKAFSTLSLLLISLLLFLTLLQVANAEPINILLLGFDFWGDETIGNSWSDINIIASLDSENHRFVFLSLMRDTYIAMPGGRMLRLNAVVRESDFDTMLQVISDNYGVEVPYYVAIGMPGFKRLINAAGGVEVTISRNEYESLVKRGMAANIPGPGTHILQGSAAYSYGRDRYMDGGDYARAGKGREVITSLFGQMRRRSPKELLEFASVAFTEIKTNLPLPEIFSLIVQLTEIEEMAVEDYGIPIAKSFQYVTVHGMSTVQLDWEVNREAIQKYLAGEQE